MEPSSRRTILKAGAAAVALGGTGLGAALARAQESTSDMATPTECVLTPGLTEGPYYLDGQLLRSDITEGKPGVPVTLQIAVQDITACDPLTNAAVEIWHCDAQGYYSGISGENPGGGGEPTGDDNLTTTFLRGIQLTDENGTATFSTVYPGWYTSRTVHIHMKVHVEGQARAPPGFVHVHSFPNHRSRKRSIVPGSIAIPAPTGDRSIDWPGTGPDDIHLLTTGLSREECHYAAARQSGYPGALPESPAPTSTAL